MISQTRSELYKLSRSTVVLIVMFFLILLNVYMSTQATDKEPIYSAGSFILYYTDFDLDSVKHMVKLDDSQAEDLYDLFWETHPTQFKYVLHKNLGMLILTMIIAPYYIGMEFKSRSFNNALYVGRSRSTVYFSKVITYFFAVFVMSFISALLITQLCASRVFSQLPSEYVWRCIMMRVLLDLGIMSLPLFFTFLFRGPVFAGMAAFIYSLTMNIAGPAKEGFFSFDPNSLKMLPEMWLQSTPQDLILKGIIVPVSFIIISTLLGWLCFSKAQLK